MMNDHGKSDEPIVPMKLPNDVGQPAEAAGEGRGSTKGNPTSETRTGHSAGTCAHSELVRVRQAAKADKTVKFTALFHHITLDRLRLAFFDLKKKAAAGVDGVTWRQYEAELESNLQDLHDRLHRGAYRAKPTRRVYIPKTDGRQRPLGIASLEDKLVQRAVVEVLNAIYESDFLCLFKACGAEITEGNGSRVRVYLNGVRAVFHRPHPQKETDKGVVVSVRRFLSEAGVKP